MLLIIQFKGRFSPLLQMKFDFEDFFRNFGFRVETDSESRLPHGNLPDRYVREHSSFRN